MREYFYDKQHQVNQDQNWEVEYIHSFFSFHNQECKDAKTVAFDDLAETNLWMYKNGLNFLPDSEIDMSMRKLLWIETGLQSVENFNGVITLGNARSENAQQMHRRMSGVYNAEKAGFETFSSQTCFSL